MKEVAVLINTRLNENNEVVVSGRELHEFLEVGTAYKDWFPRMTDYGFEEGIDYLEIIEEVDAQKRARTYKQINHLIKIDMAKEIAMIQRSDKGKQARKYFLEIERKWNSPEMVMKRALEFANQQVALMEKRIEDQKPKVLLAESISDSNSTILVRELAKIIKQNGVDIGEKRLFLWLRDNGYLVRKTGTDYNMPTQRSMDLGLFRIKEGTRTSSEGIKITKTVKVTGKGQQYFVAKLVK